MAEVLDARAPEAVVTAARALEAGGLVVFPTDTVYGLAARPDIPGATARTFTAKRRPRGLTLPVLVADGVQAAAVAALDGRARALARAFWPGGLTVVLPRTDRSRGWDLGKEEATIGIRVPGHPVAAALLRAAGPLAVTSANLSGQPTPATCADIRSALGDEVTVYLCDDPVPGTASTVVDLTSDRPRVLRTGAVAPEDVLAALGPVG